MKKKGTNATAGIKVNALSLTCVPRIALFTKPQFKTQTSTI